MQAKIDQPDSLADMLAALGEPTRLRIVNLLQFQPLCVCDLQNVLGLSEPLVSRHLTRLRFAGLVTCTREGNRMLYRLSSSDSPIEVVLRRFLRDIARNDASLQRDLDRCHDLLSAGWPRKQGGSSDRKASTTRWPMHQRVHAR